MKCPHCTEDDTPQLELLRREQDRAAAPGNKVATYLCNTCARTFRVHEPKQEEAREPASPTR
jgi:transposase-like protein